MYVITLDNIHASQATGCFVDIPKEPIPEGGVACILPVGTRMYVERISLCRTLMILAFDRDCLRNVGSTFWIPRRLLQEVGESDDEWFEVVHPGAKDISLIYPGRSVPGDAVFLWGHIRCSFQRVRKVPLPPPTGAGEGVVYPQVNAEKQRELAFFNAIVNGCCPRGNPCRYHK